MKPKYIVPTKTRKRDRIYGQSIDSGRNIRPKLICVQCYVLIRLSRN
jgi:hypothetical protein